MAEVTKKKRTVEFLFNSGVYKNANGMASHQNFEDFYDGLWNVSQGFGGGRRGESQNQLQIYLKQAGPYMIHAMRHVANEYKGDGEAPENAQQALARELLVRLKGESDAGFESIKKQFRSDFDYAKTNFRREFIQKSMNIYNGYSCADLIERDQEFQIDEISVFEGESAGREVEELSIA